MSKRDAIVLSILVSILTGTVVSFYQSVFLSHGNDLIGPLCGARQIYQNSDPYDETCLYVFGDGKKQATYPLTTYLVAMFFAWMGRIPASIVMWSIMIGVLSYGIFCCGRLYLFWMFVSPTFLLDLNHLQIAPSSHILLCLSF